MKTLILSTAILVGLAAPSFANDQLALSLGLEPGRFSAAELTQIQRALEDDDRTFLDFALNGSRNLTGPNQAVRDFVISQAEADDDGFPGRFTRDAGREVISTQNFGVSEAARDFAIQQARENDDRQLLRLLEQGGSLSAPRSLF